MIWQDRGFLLHQSAFGERSFIVTFLTENHGRCRALSRISNRATFVSGSTYDIAWTSRLEDNLGTFSLDTPYGPVWTMIHHPGALRALNLMCFICTSIVPERVAMPHLFAIFGETLEQLATPNGLRAYDAFETALFQELGYDPVDRNPGTTLWERLEHRHQDYMTHWPNLHRMHRMRQGFLSDIGSILAPKSGARPVSLIR